MISSTPLAKANRIKIIKTFKSKNKVQHYSIIFYGIPFIDKEHKIYYAEVIFHNCTFTHNLSFTHADKSKYNIQINKKEIIINNAQSFLFNNQFSFEYHEEPGTTKLYTVQYPKEDL